ncbi:hypothetical protein Q5752_001632 [Cryptotrichosporon argae]
MADHDDSAYALICTVHQTILDAIDTALTWDQLNSPPVNYSLVRPLVDRFTPRYHRGSAKGVTARLHVPERHDAAESGANGDAEDHEFGLGAVLYALMASRIQFISLSEADLSYAPLQTTRAAFCELLATKIIRTFPSAADEVELVSELVKTFGPYDGAPEDILAVTFGDDRRDIEASRASALELAIISSAKHFLSLPLIQHLISQIYTGQLIYTPSAARGLISDSYVSERNRLRRRASYSSFTSLAQRSRAGLTRKDAEDLAEVYVYNPYEAGWLDHQRLKVPKWRKLLEFMTFTILIALFVATLSRRGLTRVSVLEVVFILYTLGFALDEFAQSKEHGWSVYAANTWNAFDLTFIAIFLLYLVLRVLGLATHSPNLSELGFDILAVGACVIFPRLVFFMIKDNIIVLALKEMITTFVGFMCLTTVAFSGICFCLWTLGRATWTVKQIVWLMLQIWFGSSYLGFQASASFHPLFGPVVLISYAALCNTLLITILISILSNKFAAINQNAQQEHLFQRVVNTVEGVKSDAVFSYLPPINLLALTVLGPLSWVLSPRALHRTNVFLIRVTNFPILFAISAYERYKHRALKSSLRLSHADHVQRPSMFDSFLGGTSELLIRSVFESMPTRPSAPASATASAAPKAAVMSTPPRASSVAAANDDTKLAGADRLGSPLAKLFGGRRRVLSGLSAVSTFSLDDDEPASASAPGGKDARAGGMGREEGDRLRKEIQEVRESQLRVEELLNKVLAGAAD